MPVNIHGKQYLTVAERIATFRSEHSIEDGWGVVTTLLSRDKDVVVVGASIIDPNGKMVASGLAEEYRSSSQINSTSALENAETSAIGRALAAAGLGGTEYASADEVANAIHQQQSRPAPQRQQQQAPPRTKSPSGPPPELVQHVQNEAPDGWPVYNILGYYEPKGPKGPWSFKTDTVYLKAWDENVVKVLQRAKHDQQPVCCDVTEKAREYQGKTYTDHIVNAATPVMPSEMIPAQDEGEDDGLPF